MTDTPEGEPEQRLPATRPSAEPAPVERFSAPPAARSLELTPDRAAQIVRSSSNARWIGFLTIIVVVLFITIYWFYELGGPLGITEARLGQETEAQQVTAVERGYNVFEANCSRCHGVNGEGGIGPVLNRQDKLFAHLNENYLRTVLTAGGRYVCGNPDSLMPVWSNEANPPGPLNYRQIDELIAFLRATNDKTYIVRDAELGTPKIDPLTGEERTFTGWRDPNYKPDPGATPYPACWTKEFETASAAPSGGASGAPSAGASGAPSSGAPSAGASGAPSAGASAEGSAAPSGGAAGGTVVSIVAQGIAFTTAAVSAPAGAAFTLEFDNEDAGTPHDVQIKDASGAEVFKTDIFPGVEKRSFPVPALAAGSYPFACTVHSNMTGTLTVQ
jgi:mono/diheme cytochrome c family protein/plastocyanin